MNYQTTTPMPGDPDYPATQGAFPVWSKVYTRPGERTFVEIPPQARLAVRRIANYASQEMKKSTAQLIAGTIIAAVWSAQMRDLMKTLYMTVWLLSIGGFLFDDNTARNLFYAFVLSQFNFLDHFYEEIEEAEEEEEELSGRFISRAGMYGKWANAEHQNILLSAASKQAQMEGRRVLGENENHCHDSGDRPGCVELPELGWMPVEQLVPIGDATCLSQCYCYYEFRRKRSL